MKLRLVQSLQDSVPLDLEIFLPYEDLEEYESQRPVALRAEVVWQRMEGEHLHCGVKFIEMSAEHKQGLQRCFDYFNQNANYG